MDLRRNAAPPTPITLCDPPVDTVESFHFLGIVIAPEISSLTEKAPQRMYFLWQLRKFSLPK